MRKLICRFATSLLVGRTAHRILQLVRRGATASCLAAAPTIFLLEAPSVPPGPASTPAAAGCGSRLPARADALRPIRPCRLLGLPIAQRGFRNAVLARQIGVFAPASCSAGSVFKSTLENVLELRASLHGEVASPEACAFPVFKRSPRSRLHGRERVIWTQVADHLYIDQLLKSPTSETAATKGAGLQ
jgi:hypothetical protein